MTNPNESGNHVFLQNGLTHDSHVDIGLTKREYFAAKQTYIVGELSPESIYTIMGSLPPKDKMGNIKYWISAEATVRVMKADALIEALNKTK